MASLAVPRPYRRPLGELASLSDEAARALFDRVDGLPAYASVVDIREALSEIVGDGADGLAAALLSLRGLFRTFSAEEIGGALRVSQDLDLDLDARAVLEERATALLSTSALSTTAVAVDLQTQHQRNYQSARVFTDVRPVFPDQVDEGPTGAVIVEMLQVQTWSRDGESETIFIALDEKDLSELREVVDRALKKTAALRRFLDERGLAYFQLEEDGE